jgi:hypothetical protein
VKALEDTRQLLLGDARPGVANGKSHSIIFRSQAQGYFALERELERIRDEVHHDLFPLRGVDVDGFG